MEKILVFIEIENNKIKKTSLDLLNFISNLNKKETFILSKSKLSEDIQRQIAKYNDVKENHYFQEEEEEERKIVYHNEFYLFAFEKIIAEVKPSLIFSTSSIVAKDFFPALAEKIGAGIISDAIIVDKTPILIEKEKQIKEPNQQKTELNDFFEVKKMIYSGKILTSLMIRQTSIKIFLVSSIKKSSSLDFNNEKLKAEKSSKTGFIKEYEHKFENTKLEKTDNIKGFISQKYHEIKKQEFFSKIIKYSHNESDKLDLQEADIVVVGGKGLKEKQNFKLVEDLAHILNASVGATRSIVDEGWVSHSIQIGQTGKVIAPKLYIGIGVSGSIQHLMGITQAETVIAINKDSNAPILQKANLGIVGDLFEIVPLLIENIKLEQIKSQN